MRDINITLTVLYVRSIFVCFCVLFGLFNDKLTAVTSVLWPTDRLHGEFFKVKGHICIVIVVNELDILVI